MSIKLATAASVAALFVAAPALAADLNGVGGNCCADLEERVAELEATAARKGNRKVSLTVYGEVNKALLGVDGDWSKHKHKSKNGVLKDGYPEELEKGSFNDKRVIDNSASPSFFGFAGNAQINPEWNASFVVEIGIGGRDGGGGTNDIYVHRSYVSLGGPVGKVSLGHLSQATDGISEITTANTGAAVQPLSLRPLIGPEFGEVLDLYDGTRADAVRYDSPMLGGFQASASWAAGDQNDDVWDVALRYAGEFGGFRVAAGAGYRDGIVVNGGGGSIAVTGDSLDVQTWTVTGSVMHMQSGLFLTGVYGRQEGDLGELLLSEVHNDLKSEGWAVIGGIEQKSFPLGRTTIFGEYGDVSVDAHASKTFESGTKTKTADVGLTYWGGGVVQAIDAAAMDLYVNFRKYEFDGGGGKTWCGEVNCWSHGIITSGDATVITGGARIRF